MGEIQRHLTSLVKDVCISRLQFETGVHFEGVLGVTLDDSSVLLIDIRDSFTKSDSLQCRQNVDDSDKCLSIHQRATHCMVASDPKILTRYKDKAGPAGNLDHTVDVLANGLHNSQVNDGSSSFNALYNPLTNDGTPSFAESQAEDCMHTINAPSSHAGQPRPASNGTNQALQLVNDGPCPTNGNGPKEFTVFDIKDNSDASCPQIKAHSCVSEDNQATNHVNLEEAIEVVLSDRMPGDGAQTATTTATLFYQQDSGGSTFITERKDKSVSNGIDIGTSIPESSTLDRNEDTFCQSKSTGESGAENHCVGEDTAGDVKSPGDDGVRWFKCDLCSYKSRFKNNLKRHFFTHESVGFPCKTCKKHFRDVTVLAEHVRVTHDDVMISCKECGQGFKTRRALQYHRQKHSGQFKYTCEQCGKKFATTTHYNDHKNTHSGAREVCTSCGKSFQYRSSYNKHLRAGCIALKQPQSSLTIGIQAAMKGLTQPADRVLANSSKLENLLTKHGDQLSADQTMPGSNQLPTTVGNINNIQKSDLRAEMPTTDLKNEPKYMVTIPSNYIGPVNQPGMNPATQAVDLVRTSTVKKEQLNGDIVLNDSFIDRIAASIKTSQDPGDASFNIISDLILEEQPGSSDGIGKMQKGRPDVVTDGKSMDSARDALSDIPMQVGHHVMHGPFYLGTQGLAETDNFSTGNQQGALQVSSHRQPGHADVGGVPRVSSGLQQKPASLCPGDSSSIIVDATGTNHSNVMPTRGQASMHELEPGSDGDKSPMMWPDEGLVLYRFPMLEQEYAMQMGNTEQSVPSRSDTQDKPQPSPSLTKPEAPNAISTVLRVVTEDNYPETYCMYPLPKHCYDSDSLSACLSSDDLHSPEFFNDQGMVNGTVSDGRPSATVLQISTNSQNAPRVFPTQMNVDGVATDVSNDISIEASVAVCNLAVALQPNTSAENCPSQTGQSPGSTRGNCMLHVSPACPTVMDATSGGGRDESSHLENGFCPSTEHILPEKEPVVAADLDLSEQYIGAIYPKFSEDMPPNIFHEEGV